MAIKNSFAGGLALLTRGPPRKYPSRTEKSPLTLELEDVVVRYAKSKRQRFYYAGHNPDGTIRFGIVERTQLFDVPEKLYEALGRPAETVNIRPEAFLNAYNSVIGSRAQR